MLSQLQVQLLTEYIKLFWIIYVFKSDEYFKIIYKIAFHNCVPVANWLRRRIGITKTTKVRHKTILGLNSVHLLC